MESASQVNVPLRSGGKKMRKRRELDALVAHSLAKRANKKNCAGNGIHSQDQLLSPSTDEQDDIAWPKVVRSSNRSRSRKFSFIQTCIPIVFVMSVALSLGFVYWLHFDLKQQLYDYRSRIEEVALTSKNVPEEMQKWHETSKSLEQNQTFLASRIVDIHAIIEDLKSRFVVYEAKLNEKKDYQKDEKTVADFGAEVKAVSADVERLRDKFVELQKGQTDFRNEINALKGNFSETIANASIRANNNETFYSDELKKAQVVIFDEIKSLRTNLTVVNDTLSQKIKGLSEDQTSMRSQIDGLQERTANITSHVVSIDLDWSQNKRIVSDFEVFKNSSNYELQSLKNITIDLKNAVESVRLDCNKVQNELSRVETQTENQNNNTAKKDPLKQILDDKIANLAPNSALNLGEKPKPTSGTNLSEATKSSTTTGVATENSSVVSSASVPEGKPKLLSIQSISKPI